MDLNRDDIAKMLKESRTFRDVVANLLSKEDLKPEVPTPLDRLRDIIKACYCDQALKIKQFSNKEEQSTMFNRVRIEAIKKTREMAETMGIDSLKLLRTSKDFVDEIFSSYK